jgi:hypothetical protein
LTPLEQLSLLRAQALGLASVHDAHIRVAVHPPPGSPDPQTPSRARPHCLASGSWPALAELDQRGGVAGQPILVIGAAREILPAWPIAPALRQRSTTLCDKIFEDTVSGAKADRPGLAAALAYVREGDTLVVWRLDRLGRSLPHLIETIGALEARGGWFSFADGSHRHHHVRRTAHLPCVRRARPVRA